MTLKIKLQLIILLAILLKGEQVSSQEDDEEFEYDETIGKNNGEMEDLFSLHPTILYSRFIESGSVKLKPSDIQHWINLVNLTLTAEDLQNNELVKDYYEGYSEYVFWKKTELSKIIGNLREFIHAADLRDKKGGKHFLALEPIVENIQTIMYDKYPDYMNKYDMEKIISGDDPNEEFSKTYEKFMRLWKKIIDESKLMHQTAIPLAGAGLFLRLEPTKEMLKPSHVLELEKVKAQIKDLDKLDDPALDKIAETLARIIPMLDNTVEALQKLSFETVKRHDEQREEYQSSLSDLHFLMEEMFDVYNTIDDDTKGLAILMTKVGDLVNKQNNLEKDEL